MFVLLHHPHKILDIKYTIQSENLKENYHLVD
jgi:hypothetical protein